MKAFFNSESIKQKYISRVKAHIAADNLIRGTGWENGKGCAVGCTLENYNHAQYEKELGIPEWLARVEDTLFEGMSLEKSKTWPLVFLESINIGADLEKVKAPFMIYILEQNLKYMDSCVFDKDKNPDVVSAIEGSKKSVQTVIDLYKSEKWDNEAAWSARSAAWSAARSAESAARSASWSARSAAWSASWSARSASWSARSAAWSARSAESAAFDDYADKLLEILRNIND